LQALPELDYLCMWGLTPEQDLTALTHLPKLDSLVLGGVQVSGDILAQLPALDYLNITPASPWDPAILNPLQNLTELVLYASDEPSGGIDRLAGQLRQLNNVTKLWLNSCTWLTDLTALASIDALTTLGIDGTLVTDLTALARIPRLDRLTIGNSEHLFDLSPLAGLTQLKDLWIVNSAPGLDLRPLHGKRMNLHLSRQIKLTGTAANPDRVRIRRF
jgi:hypothetical protein